MDTAVARRTALITGASSGFGAEFARLFAADGFDLILVARSGAAMEDIGRVEEERNGVNVTVMPKDLSKPGAARELLSSVQERGIHVDALVNNAGGGADKAERSQAPPRRTSSPWGWRFPRS